MEFRNYVEVETSNSRGVLALVVRFFGAFRTSGMIRKRARNGVIRTIARVEEK